MHALNNTGDCESLGTRLESKYIIVPHFASVVEGGSRDEATKPPFFLAEVVSAKPKELSNVLNHDDTTYIQVQPVANVEFGIPYTWLS